MLEQVLPCQIPRDPSLQKNILEEDDIVDDWIRNKKI